MSSSPVPSSREVSGLDAQRPLLATLRRHRRLGAFTQDPRELEALTGLPFDQLAAVAPGLRSFAHAGRQLVFIEVVGSALAGPETAPTFSALRRCLGHAIDYGYGHWPELRCVFTPAVAELVENLIPSLQRRRDPRRELAEHLATTQLRRELGISREVDPGAGALSAAAVVLLNDALSSPAVTAQLLTRLASLPIGGDHRAVALDGLRVAGLVTDEHREALSRLLRVSSGRVRIAAARALGGPRAEAVLAHALTERRKHADIPVRAAAALVEIAPHHPLIPDALELLQLGLDVPDVARLAHEALKQWRTGRRAEP